MENNSVLRYKFMVDLSQIGGLSDAEGDEPEEKKNSVNVNDIKEDDGEQDNKDETIATHNTLYTIKKGSILYHGSSAKDTFNPDEIKLGDDTLVAFFSHNERFALDYIKGCATYPMDNGYIHKFEVIKDIPRIFILNQFNRGKDWDQKLIDDKYCKSTKGAQRYNGICFFVPKGDQAALSAVISENVKYAGEFALCDPQEFLKYVTTQKCLSARKISKPYSFAE